MFFGGCPIECLNQTIAPQHGFSSPRFRGEHQQFPTVDMSSNLRGRGPLAGGTTVALP